MILFVVIQLLLFCYPNDKGGIVKDFAAYDSKLLEDIDRERAVLDQVYEDYKDEVTHWYYGHFHKSQMQTINNTMFKLFKYWGKLFDTTQTITIHCKIVAIEDGQYTAIVVEDLNRIETDDLKYVTVVKCPN